MASLTVGNFAFSINSLDLLVLADGVVTFENATTLAVDVGGGQVDRFIGTGFAFSFLGGPVGGTITGFEEARGGQTSFQIAGVSIGAVQFYNLALSGNRIALFNLFFSGDDNMTGGIFGDVISGFAGHDNIFGGSGADSLRGGEGNDHIYGQSANGGTNSGDMIAADDGSDYVQGNAGSDTIDGGDGSDRINGGGDQDMIVGGTGNDTVNGNLGDDTISGQLGNDSIRGGQGNDSIQGNEGNDVLLGDLGADTLNGGAGVDTFVFSGNASLITSSADVIVDFQDGSDRIGVGYAPTTVLTGPVQTSFSAAVNVAQQLFDANAGNSEVAVLKVGNDTYIFYSSDGGTSANSAVQLVALDAAALTLADFL